MKSGTFLQIRIGQGRTAQLGGLNPRPIGAREAKHPESYLAELRLQLLGVWDAEVPERPLLGSSNYLLCINYLSWQRINGDHWASSEPLVSDHWTLALWCVRS